MCPRHLAVDFETCAKAQTGPPHNLLPSRPEHKRRLALFLPGGVQLAKKIQGIALSFELYCRTTGALSNLPGQIRCLCRTQ